MEIELIEALLAERALGNLSKQTCELLDIYIGSNSEYVELATSFEQLSQAGEQLAVCREEVSLPDFPREQIEQALSPTVVSSGYLRWLSTAAIFLIGLGVVFTANNPDKEPVLADDSVEQHVVVEPLIHSGMIEGIIDKDRMLKRYEGLRNNNGVYDRSYILKMKGLL